VSDGARIVFSLIAMALGGFVIGYSFGWKRGKNERI